MLHFQSKKWKMFASRPTSILKRDFMKWVYLSVGRIKGFRFTKLLCIGNGQEIDIYVDEKEDQKNYARIAKQYEKREVRRILRLYDATVSRYEPQGKDEVNRSRRAMKDIGPILVYSYYLERLLGQNQTNEQVRTLVTLNSKLRDGGAKIIYPLYDQARSALLKKYKNRDIDWLTLSELQKVPPQTDVRTRKIFYIFWGTTKNTSLYTGEAARQFLAREKFSQIRSVSTTKLVGLPAGGGIVKGRVKIVRGMRDIQNCTGKVIVSRDTVIEYTPMLKKNLAIVTDMGGISSHAAVTAREFKIPCVVGTKYATEVLKDGDMVEVDAEKGVVKKIM